MSIFQANVVTSSSGAPPPRSDSKAPGVGRRSANPANIRSPNFLSGGGLAAAVDQAILHGNGTVVVPALNEEVTGNANLKVTKDRKELVKGMTNSIVKGGVDGTFGLGVKSASAGPFVSFVSSDVYEGTVNSYQYAPQREHTLGVSNSLEFGTRTVNRFDSETKTVYGTQADYKYGDVHSHFQGFLKEEIVLGSKHDTYDGVLTLQAVAPLNFLLGLGLHLQCRPGAELNLNIWNVVVAISESLLGLVNLDCLIAPLAAKGIEYGLSGAKLSADVGNVRYILGIPVGNMRIP
jgi:hypothetical protein